MISNLKLRYFKLLAKEMVAMYGLTMEVALAALKKSSINDFIDEHPDYVDHIQLSDWAEEVHTEMFS